MKRFSLYIMLMLTAGLVTSCSDDDNKNGNGKRVFDDQTAPEVVSVSPEADAIDQELVTEVVVTYSEPIVKTPQTTIRIYAGDASTYYYADDELITVEGNQLIIPLETRGSTTYKIEILKPSVRDESYNFATDYSFAFTTKLVNNFVAEDFDINPSLVNENAIAETKAVYEYLVSQFGKTTLMATMAENNHNIKYAEFLNEVTGKYPAIAGFDYLHMHFSQPLNPSNWIDYTDTSVEENWWKAGGLVTYSWHWAVPSSQADINNYSSYAFYCNDAGALNTTFSARYAQNASRWESQLVNQHLEIIANYLLALQEKGIPVIWRPLHEAAGNNPNGGQAWFWWGNSGAAAYKKLWIRMFNYFKEKGVNNLIWVWTSCLNDEVWYPGDQYVDIVSYDYYPQPVDFHKANLDAFNELRDLTKGKKLIAMSECGPIPSYVNMASDGAMWSWVMPWGGDFTVDGVYNPTDFLIDLTSSPYIITRDELPSFGQY